jgi:hypothetical protein
MTTLQDRPALVPEIPPAKSCHVCRGLLQAVIGPRKIVWECRRCGLIETSPKPRRRHA